MPDVLVVEEVGLELAETKVTELLIERETTTEVVDVPSVELLLEPISALEFLDLTGPTQVLEVAVQGPPGPPGATGPAGGVALMVVVGEPVGGHRGVVLDVAGLARYASNTDIAHFGRLAGVTAGAASTGTETMVVRAGVMMEPSWAWAPDAPVFLSAGGLLTQSPPTTGFLQVVGVALSATTLFVNPREPIAIL